MGQDLARAGIEGRLGLLRGRRPHAVPRQARASTWSATAAPPASETPGPLDPRGLPTPSRTNDLAVVSVLSGNRNFEGRINPDVKMNYLASPPLVVAYALAGLDGRRPLQRPAGPGHRRQRRLHARHLALAPPTSRRSSPRRSAPRCSPTSTPRCSPATSAGRPWRPPTARRSPGTRTRPTSASRRSSTTCPPSRSGQRHRGRAGAAQARRLGHHRPHQPGRCDQEGLARRHVPEPSTASSSVTSTPTARAAATTR